MKKTGLDEAAAIVASSQGAGHHPLRLPGDVAALVRFIVSPQGRWLHGSAVDIDGGQVIPSAACPCMIAARFDLARDVTATLWHFVFRHLFRRMASGAMGLRKEPLCTGIILIATDGSVLAEKAIAHGLSLAKSVGAKVTALIVEAPFNVYECARNRECRRCPKPLPSTRRHIKQHAGKVLSHVAEAANAAGVPCETVQLEHDHPYEAIITTAEGKGCDIIVMASHGPKRDVRGSARKRDQ